MITLKGFKYRLYPTKEQKQLLLQQGGNTRFLWNKLLGENIKLHAETGKFKKPEMYKAIIEGNVETPIFDMLNKYSYLTDRSKIPNPIEDIIDATFACKIQINRINDSKR